VADDSCGACGEVKRLVGRGLCKKCWQRAKRAGTLDRYDRVRRTFAESYQLAQASETDSGCWPWPVVSETGYPAVVKFGSRGVSAHHAVWMLVNGPVPEGMTIDHRCHTDDLTCPGGPSDPHRRCVRPDHLQLASMVEQHQWRHGYRAPHCRNGHPRNDMNVRLVTKVDRKNGKPYVYRVCRVCQREAMMRHRNRG
jgi:hypothetical protein